MKIKIGFSRAKSPFKLLSLLIRVYLNKPYSHVYLNFHSIKYDRDIIYEAVGKGVRFIGLNTWNKHALSISEYEIDISDENYRKLMIFCIDKSGEDYGMLQNFGILITRLFKLEKNPFKSGMNCSELLAYILELEGYKIDVQKDLVTPKDIENSLLSQLNITTINRDDRQ